MKHILLIGLILFNLTNASAQDRLFNYTYQSSVLNKGQKEIEVWTTVLQGKEDYFREIQSRIEYEIGLGSNLQTAFYVNTKQKAFLNKTTGEIQMEPSEIALSNEWKYKISDAMADRFGCAAYAEFTIAPDEYEIELKAIFDKKLGATTQVVNLIFEPEWKTTTRNNQVATETELKYDINYGISFDMSPRWNLGAEIINKNVFIKAEDFTHSALFLGPTISYHVDKFWINLAASPQIANLNNQNNNTLDLEEFTRSNFRLLFSFSF